MGRNHFRDGVAQATFGSFRVPGFENFGTSPQDHSPADILERCLGGAAPCHRPPARCSAPLERIDAAAFALPRCRRARPGLQQDFHVVDSLSAGWSRMGASIEEGGRVIRGVKLKPFFSICAGSTHGW